MSRPPSRVRACSTRLSGSPGFDTSAAAQPAALIALPDFSIAAASRDEMKTFAPSSSSASAQARPSPLLAAVTSARRSFSPRSIPELWLAARIHVPLGDVLEAIRRLDDLVDPHAVNATRDRVVVVGGVKEYRGRSVGHQHLEVDIGRKTRLGVDGRAPVLEVAVDQTPATRVSEVQAA